MSSKVFETSTARFRLTGEAMAKIKAAGYSIEAPEVHVACWTGSPDAGDRALGYLNGKYANAGLSRQDIRYEQ